MLHLSTRFCAEDEFEDLQLLEDDAVVTSVDGHHRRLDHVWGDVMALKTLMGVSSLSCPDHSVHGTAVPATQQHRFRKNILNVEKAQHRV